MPRTGTDHRFVCEGGHQEASLATEGPVFAVGMLRDLQKNRSPCSDAPKTDDGRAAFGEASAHGAARPDPGAYPMDSAFDNKNMGRPSASFRSQTQRDPFYADRHTLGKDVDVAIPADSLTSSGRGQRAFADNRQRYRRVRLESHGYAHTCLHTCLDESSLQMATTQVQRVRLASLAH